VDGNDAREFAEKNQGAIVSFDHYDSRNRTTIRVRARVVGWKDPDSMWAVPVVLVEPEEDAFGSPRDWIEHSWTAGWWWMRSCDLFMEVNDWRLTVERPEPARQNKPHYPHSCTACKKPAQLIFNMVDCSNWKCRHYR